MVSINPLQDFLKVQISDPQLAVPGEPTPADVAAAGLGVLRLVYYIGAGTSERPDYTWIIDSDGGITETSNPETIRSPITEASTIDIPDPNDIAQVVAFRVSAGLIGPTWIWQGNDLSNPDYAWAVDDWGGVIRVK